MGHHAAKKKFCNGRIGKTRTGVHFKYLKGEGPKQIVGRRAQRIRKVEEAIGKRRVRLRMVVIAGAVALQYGLDDILFLHFCGQDVQVMTPNT